MGDELDKTLWAGNLSERVTEDILYELFLQAGPLSRVKIAKEKDGRQKNFAFITFSHDVSVPYTIQLMDGMQLFGRNLRLQSRPGSIHQKPRQQQQQQQQQQQYMHPQQHQQQFSSPQSHGQYMNPYQHNQPVPSNPYGKNQPIRNQNKSSHQPPNLHKSHTWHGDDLDQMYYDNSQEQGRDTYQKRDNSGSRHRDNDGGGRDRGARDDYYGQNYYQDDKRDSKRHRDDRYGQGQGNRQEDFDSKRQKVLHKQDQMLNRYRHNDGQSGGYNRRGRY